jgi:hypothetical protein
MTVPWRELHCSLKNERINSYTTRTNRACGSVEVEALCYKPEGRGFETQLYELIFFPIYLILPAALGPQVYSAPNRNKYQKQNNFSGE